MSTCHRKIPSAVAPSSATVGSAMYHQCGRRSSTTSSPGLISFRGNPTARTLRSAVPQLTEPGVVDAEVVGHLVHHGHPHLLHDVDLRAAAGEYRVAVDRDPVGRPAALAVVVAAGRERHALVQPEQAPDAAAVL